MILHSDLTPRLTTFSNTHYSTYFITQSTNFKGNGKKLRCCALRPNGIYGENEKRHLPRIADNIEAGYTIFRFGTGKVYIDWCHVNNLIQVRDVDKNSSTAVHSGLPWSSHYLSRTKYHG